MYFFALFCGAFFKPIYNAVCKSMSFPPIANNNIEDSLMDTSLLVYASHEYVSCRNSSAPARDKSFYALFVKTLVIENKVLIE